MMKPTQQHQQPSSELASRLRHHVTLQIAVDCLVAVFDVRHMAPCHVISINQFHCQLSVSHSVNCTQM